VEEKKVSRVMKLAAKDLQSPEQRREITVCVVGCGRAGLTTASLFIEAGFSVFGVDSSSHTVHQLKKGKSPFTETDFRKFIEPHIKSDRFRATTNLRKAVAESNVIIVGIQSALDKKKKPDYSRLEKTCKLIGLSLNKGSLIIFQNIMGPGITETVAKETLETASGLETGKDFGLAYSSTLNNSTHTSKDTSNGTTVVGGITKRSLKIACLILDTITKGEIVRVKNIKTAEAVKLLEESYKDVNIAFANEYAHFCEEAGIDFVRVRDIINPLKFSGMSGLHKSRDSYFLVEEAEAVDVKLRLLSLATKINDETMDHAIHLLRDSLRTCQKSLRRSKIAVLGISSVPNRKRTNNSATKNLVNQLKKRGASVTVYDPFFTHKELLTMGYDAEATLSKTVEGADCIVVVVAHDRFRRLNLRRTQLLMKQPAAIVDMGQVINPVKAEKAGFVYRGFGRGVWTK
jgi:UDP-N-acetyl-D-mannosaminuronic acid dehydrogenase